MLTNFMRRSMSILTPPPVQTSTASISECLAITSKVIFQYGGKQLDVVLPRGINCVNSLLIYIFWTTIWISNDPIVSKQRHI